jgi:hypothetical protein
MLAQWPEAVSAIRATTVFRQEHISFGASAQRPISAQTLEFVRQGAAGRTTFPLVTPRPPMKSQINVQRASSVQTKGQTAKPFSLLAVHAK